MRPVASIDSARLGLHHAAPATSLGFLSLKDVSRGKGWFRDVRLRRSADAFMRSSKLFQKASKLKPGPLELSNYEEELQRHLEQLRSKLGAPTDRVSPSLDLFGGSVPMNECREISPGPSDFSAHGDFP